MKSINGERFKMMLLSGANHLYNNYPEVDALNVFPVPDGDTGMNMNLTMQSGSKEIFNRNDLDVYTIGKVFSKGLLMGARGNSGVITSQIFRGIADGLLDKKDVDAVGLAEAFANGSAVAYKAVIRPVEGTILTVIRESSEGLLKKVTPNMTIEQAFEILLTEARASLARTPDLLPVLKEVGVVDSGGTGLVKILEGMQSALNGEFVDKNEATAFTNIQGSALVEAGEDNDEFGYCTEFIMRLGPDSVKKVFQKKRFTGVLNNHGNSLVVVQDDDIVKVHVHTLNPGNVLAYAQQFGEFVKLKIENMTEQHNEILFNEQQRALAAQNNGVLTAKEAKTEEVKEETEHKDVAIIETSSGEGINQYFKDLGVDEIVSGGQTMNPSTNDFLEKIDALGAKTVYILPNNGNIIMAANQVAQVLEDKVNVVVIPTKTIMQGIVCAMNYNPEFDAETNKENMTEAISSVKSGCVTFAIKDTEINGVEVKKDQFMAIQETKDILSCHKNKFDALTALVDSMIDEDSGVLTILTGEDVSEEEMNKIAEYFEDKYPDIDCDIRNGGQPVYSYFVGVE